MLPVLFFLLVLPLSTAAGQFIVRSQLSWRTIETERFVFHYPLEFEEWTKAAASRADGIAAAVERIVGYAPSTKTQVVVDDPYETPNGAAWPYLDLPMITLWANPPNPRDDIGDYRSWGEMLMTHEFAHIAHLTRPTRNTTTGKLLGLLPAKVSPVAIRMPRWAIEGYATFVEGRITGTGRPHAAWRAAILRQWAIEGQFPRYSELNASSAYLGGAYAYLAGSAFLEWLAERHGDSSLVDIWRRVSARQNRTFDEAFTGVFGEPAAVLYGRFSAEVVAKAMEISRRLATAGGDTGQMVQHLARSTGDPAISTDGKRVALVTRSATVPSRVVVWSTAPEPDTGNRRRDSLLLARDPRDVASRPIFPPPKRALATLRSKGGPPYEAPRFLRDGRILLWRNSPRGDGSTVDDLYLWNPEGGGAHRVTRNQSVREGDPLPDGRSAVATQCESGWCSLVLVDLEHGDVTPLVSANLQRSFFRPRVSPDGKTVLASMHHDGRWRLVTIDLSTREIEIVDPSDGANRFDAAWLNATEVVATSDKSGIAQLERLNLRTKEVRRLTRVTGAAVAADHNPADRSVWYLTLHARGYDVRRLTAAQIADGKVDSLIAPIASVEPALSPRPRDSVAFRENTVSAPHPYRLTPRLFRWIPQPSLDADGVSGGLALVSRDVIGRSELSINGASGDASAWRGGALNALWFGFAPTVRFSVFSAVQRASASRSHVLLPLSFDVQLTGGEMSLEQTLQFDSWAARYRAGTTTAQARSLFNDIASARTMGFADGGISWTQRGDFASFSESLSSSFTFGRSFDDPFSRGLATARLSSSGPRIFPLTLSATYGRTNREAPLFEQFSLGGGPSLIIDQALLTQRIVMPALPVSTSVGPSVLTYRAAVATAPVSWYLWGGSTAPVNERFARWHRVIGVEWGMSIPAIAGTGTPAARAQIGVGESLDEPFRHKVRAYVSLVLNP